MTINRGPIGRAPRAAHLVTCPDCGQTFRSGEGHACPPARPPALGPGERLVDGEVMYSADWLSDRRERKLRVV